MPEKRAKVRVAIDRTVQCRIPALPADATMCDVSTDGCRLVMARDYLEPGWTITMEVAPRVAAKGEVMWAKGREIGIRFKPSLKGSPAIALGLEQPEIVTIPRNDTLRRRDQVGAVRGFLRAVGSKFG